MSFIVGSFLQARLEMEGSDPSLASSFLGSSTRGERSEVIEYGYRPKLTRAVRRPVQVALPAHWSPIE